MRGFEDSDDYQQWVRTLATQTLDMGEKPHTIATKSVVDVHPVGDEKALLSAGIGSVVRAYPSDVIRYTAREHYPATLPDDYREFAVELLAMDIREAMQLLGSRDDA